PHSGPAPYTRNHGIIPAIPFKVVRVEEQPFVGEPSTPARRWAAPARRKLTMISHVPSCRTYSARSATIGSTLAARAAGIQDARSAAAQSNNVAMVSIRGSHGETPKS